MNVNTTYPDGSSQRYSLPIGSSGVVNTNGTAVAWVSGDKFTVGMQAKPITINAVSYRVATFTNDQAIVLTATAGVQNGVAYSAPWARVRFRLRAKLGAVAMAALRAFYVARKGRKEPFWFYYAYETDPLFSYDPTGTESDGRYCCRFDSDFNEEWNLQRGEISLELVEIT